MLVTFENGRPTLNMTTIDHRVRVAAEKRERMRARLIESALRVFAQHGLEAAAIDLIVVEAGVSRGTLYNYYKTQDELIRDVLQTVATEVLTALDHSLADTSDPARRVARAIKTVLVVVGANPVLAQFVRRIGITSVMDDGVAGELLARDLSEGQDQGKFTFERIDAALAMVSGAVHGAIGANGRGVALDVAFAEAMTRQILLGLGVNARSASALARQPMSAAPLQLGIGGLTLTAPRTVRSPRR